MVDKKTPNLNNLPDLMTVREVADLIIAMTGSRSSVTLSEKDADRPFRFFLDITKARKNLGYTPRPLKEGLRQYLRYLDTKKKQQ